MTTRIELTIKNLAFVIARLLFLYQVQPITFESQSHAVQLSYKVPCTQGIYIICNKITRLPRYVWDNFDEMSINSHFINIHFCLHPNPAIRPQSLLELSKYNNSIHYSKLYLCIKTTISCLCVSKLNKSTNTFYPCSSHKNALFRLWMSNVSLGGKSVHYMFIIHL